VSLRGDNRFSRRDANHNEVIGWYEELYCSVVDTHTLGGGVPDLNVGIANQVNEWVEIKTDEGQLAPAQITFQKTHRGRPVVVVRTRADVINHVTNVRERLSRTHR
jgi:hypothetical protein